MKSMHCGHPLSYLNRNENRVCEKEKKNIHGLNIKFDPVSTFLELDVRSFVPIFQKFRQFRPKSLIRLVNQSFVTSIISKNVAMCQKHHLSILPVQLNAWYGWNLNFLFFLKVRLCNKQLANTLRQSIWIFSFQEFQIILRKICSTIFFSEMAMGVDVTSP